MIPRLVANITTLFVGLKLTHQVGWNWYFILLPVLLYGMWWGISLLEIVRIEDD